jgi:hypothetical protein
LVSFALASLRSSLLVSLVAACAPATQPRAAALSTAAAAGARAAPPADARCAVASRRLSAHGRGGARPQITAGGDAFAVAGEETTEHRAIRVATFDDQARPLGPSTEIADLRHAGAEPRVVADGAEFLVLWTAEEEQGSTINVRRLDRSGKPVSDVVPLVTAAGARALAALALPDGYAVAWWNWSGTPHQVAVSFFDRHDRPLGRGVPITEAPSPDPTVDLAVDAAPGRGEKWHIAWEELVGGASHVFVGELDRERLQGRIDLGPGETPELGDGMVVWERPAENALSLAGLSGGAAASFPGGHTPAAAARPSGDGVACFVRDTALEEGRTDELWCGDLTSGKIQAPARVAVEPRGVLSLQIAADRARIGVAWQAQEDDDTRVAFAVVSCAAAAPARR